MGNAIQVTDDSFKAEVLDSAVPVLVDFWAEWCGPCKMVAPILDELGAQYAGKLKIVKMDVDVNQRTPTEFGIRSIPTLIFFKAGGPVKQLVGAYPKAKLVAEIEDVLKS